jgi:hypothetical protein
MRLYRTSDRPDSGVDERAGRVEEPCEGVAQLRRVEPRGQVAFDVTDGAFEHVEPVAQRVELAACEHELVLAEAEFRGPVPSLVVTLTATLAAVLTRATA